MTDAFLIYTEKNSRYLAVFIFRPGSSPERTVLRMNGHEKTGHSLFQIIQTPGAYCLKPDFPPVFLKEQSHTFLKYEQPGSIRL